MTFFKFFIFLLSWAASFSGFSAAEKFQAIYDYNALVHPQTGAAVMVSSQHYLATRVGLQILKAGGNAIDAAIAVHYALAVVLPSAGNLGGGGFMVIHLAGQPAKTTTINFREKAPALASRDMFLKPDGSVDDQAARFSLKAVGIPGSVAGMELAQKKYGKLTMRQLIQPAIDLADKGFAVNSDLYESLLNASKYMMKFPSTARIFFPKNQVVQPGQLFRQPDLAKTLRLIAKNGASEFYRGETSRKIVSYMQKNGGLIGADDLKSYTAREMLPVQGRFGEYDIYSMAPPSSGGIHLIQMLNILENFDLKKIPHNSFEYVRLLAETMKFAYADRYQHLGDPQFTKVPQAQLISKTTAQEIALKIKQEPYRPSAKIKPLELDLSESDQTTHFSIVDAQGNAVSCTTTLNYSFGMGAVVDGTGILLNNQMDDFSAKSGVANSYGLIGNDKNSIAPGKQMLSSMTPVIVRRGDEVVLVTGSPGGSRIITTTLQIVLNTLVYSMNIAEASVAHRIHHQWAPDILFHEKWFSFDTLSLLQKQGYQLQQVFGMGSTQSILRRNQFWEGFADLRKPSSLAEGY